MGRPAEAVAKKASRRPTFVIQEHHARALHWDFRLERDGVLVSWALPKGLPMDPETNHLAVHVEDHPLEYGKFEGTIPKGEYGAGQVMIWDHGTYDTEKWRTNEVMVVLHGKRASGRYVLFPTGREELDDPPHGPRARRTSRTMPQHVEADAGVGRATCPKNDDGWAYEFKWDGVRAMRLRRRRPGAGLHPQRQEPDVDLSRTARHRRAPGHRARRSWTARSWPSTMTVVRTSRRSSKRLHVTSKSVIEKLTVRRYPASFFAFDLLYLDGHSL